MTANPNQSQCTLLDACRDDFTYVCPSNTNPSTIVFDQQKPEEVHVTLGKFCAAS